MSDTPQDIKNKNNGGRPSSYIPEAHPKWGRALARLGYDVAQICVEFGINPDTFYEWKKKHEAFAEAIKEGKTRIIDQIESAFFKNCLGYQLPLGDGKYRQVLPNVTAQIFALKCLKGDKYKETLDLRHMMLEGFDVLKDAYGENSKLEGKVGIAERELEESFTATLMSYLVELMPQGNITVKAAKIAKDLVQVVADVAERVIDSNRRNI